MKKILILSLVFTLALSANCQTIDNFGFKVGISSSNQNFHYKQDIPLVSSLKGWKNEITSFNLDFFIEKKINHYFSFIPSIGYAQKGFKEDVIISTIEGTQSENGTHKEILHNISLDLTFNIFPFKKYEKIYSKIGLKTNYLVKINSKIKGVNDSHVFVQPFKYKTFSYDAVLSIGYKINNTLFLELAYLPALSKIYDSEVLYITDRSFNFKIGVNINKYTNKSES